MRKALVAALMLLSLSAIAGERLSGANIDTRTTLAFSVKDSAVSKLLPAGWVASPPADGPNKGANLLVILVDSYFVSDAAGTSVPPFHGMVLAVPAKRAGTDAMATMVVFGIAPDKEVPGPYGVFIPGQATIERSSSVSADGTTLIQEKWSVASKAGDALEFSVRYQRGVTTRLISQARTSSGAKPEFYRIYHLDQVADVVKSAATGANRANALAFRATGPKLGELFDGAEQLIGVTSTPAYLRTIYLPE
jgi:hypothetical protein